MMLMMTSRMAAGMFDLEPDPDPVDDHDGDAPIELTIRCSEMRDESFLNMSLVPLEVVVDVSSMMEYYPGRTAKERC